MAAALTPAEVVAMTERMCGSKRRFTRGGARTVAERMRAAGNQVSPYRCPLGGADEHWHVGHVPSMTSVARIAQLIRQRAYPPTEGEPPC